MTNLATDSLEALKADIQSIRKARGPLRRDAFVRAHFWNRLVALRSNGVA